MARQSQPLPFWSWTFTCLARLTVSKSTTESTTSSGMKYIMKIWALFNKRSLARIKQIGREWPYFWAESTQPVSPQGSCRGVPHFCVMSCEKVRKVLPLCVWWITYNFDCDLSKEESQNNNYGYHLTAIYTICPYSKYSFAIISEYTIDFIIRHVPPATIRW